MKRLVITGLLLLSLSSLAAFFFANPPPAQAPDLPASYRLVDCWFSLPEEWQLQCGRMFTGSSRGGFDLPVVVIRDLSAERRPDPLVYLTGGPGSSSLLEAGNIEHWFYWLHNAGIARDLVLVDQRGTGLSEPAFRCHDYEPGLRAIWRENLSLEEEYRQLQTLVENCIAVLSSQGWSLADFSTSHSARDMIAIMEALGYQEWNLMGGSYGSRLALEWLRQDSEGVRAVILDSVYPPDKGSLGDWPELLDKSLAAFWPHCRAMQWCEGGEEEALLEVLQQLQQQPRALTVSLYGGGWPLRVVLNDHRFLGTIYSALYDETLHQHIPRAIEEVLQGGESSLVRLLANTVNSQFASEFNPMVYLAVNCSESWELSRAEYEAVRAAYPRWAAYTDHVWDYDLCRLVPRRPDLASFKEGVSADIPVLILSGGLDPVTPARWAEELAASLPRARHWHVPDTGHGVSSSRTCVHQALVRFLDAPDEPHPYPCE